jgi:hypothetical protein
MILMPTPARPYDFLQFGGFRFQRGVIAKILDDMAKKAISKTLRKRKQANHALSDSAPCQK